MQDSQITENALVVASDGDILKVRIFRPEACMHCPANGVCTTLSSSHGKEHEAKVINDCSAKVGDTVKITISEKSILTGAAIVYFLPALFLLIGAVIGNAIHSSLPMNQDVSSLTGGLILFSVSVFAVYLYSRRITILPRAVTIIESFDGGEEV